MVSQYVKGGNIVYEKKNRWLIIKQYITQYVAKEPAPVFEPQKFTGCNQRRLVTLK